MCNPSWSTSVRHELRAAGTLPDAKVKTLFAELNAEKAAARIAMRRSAHSENVAEELVRLRDEVCDTHSPGEAGSDRETALTQSCPRYVGACVQEATHIPAEQHPFPEALRNMFVYRSGKLHT